MKAGVLKLVRSCAQNDKCRELVHSAVDKLLDDTEGKILPLHCAKLRMQ